MKFLAVAICETSAVAFQVFLQYCIACSSPALILITWLHLFLSTLFIEVVSLFIYLLFEWRQADS